MSVWPLVPLGEVCAINPRLERADRPDGDAPVSFVPMAAVDEVAGVIVAAEVRPFRSVAKGHTAFRNGDVLFAKITPCMENGKAAIAANLVGGLGFGSTEFHVLRPGPHLNRGFLFHWMRTPEFRRRAKVHFTGTAGQQRVPVSFLEDFTLRLPPLEEQRRIVDILDRAASIRRLRRQAQETARKIIPALFVKMFGDPATNPMGWPIVAVAQIGDVQGGLQVTGARKALPLERPYLRVANVMRGRLDLEEIKTIRLTQTECERVRLVRGDLLIVEGHGNAKEVGRLAIWDGSIPECVHQNHLIRVRTAASCAPEYLACYLNSEAGRSVLMRCGKTTSGLNTISTSNVKQAKVPLPALNLQQEFAARVAVLTRLSEREASAASVQDMAMGAIQARLLGS